MICNLLPDNPNGFGLYEYTFNLALKNIAKKHNIEYRFIGLRDGNLLRTFDFPLPEYDSPIIFLCHHPNFDLNCRSKIMNKCKNAKIVICGGDTVYYGAEAVTKLKPDLFLDTIKSEVEKLSKFCPTHHFYWTISEDIIKLAKSNVNNTKIYDGICLCRGTPKRSKFFDHMKNKDKKILYNLNENNLDKILNYYSQTKYTIGITHESQGLSNNNKRSMKGMRDWIGTFCDTLLIYDDYPDIIDIDCVPIYEFDNPQSCLKLMNSISNEEYVNLLQKQKCWLTEHTMERQLEKILIKENLI